MKKKCDEVGSISKRGKERAKEREKVKADRVMKRGRERGREKGREGVTTKTMGRYTNMREGEGREGMTSQTEEKKKRNDCPPLAE